MAIAHRTAQVSLAELVSAPAKAAEYRLIDIANGPAVEFTFEKGGERFVLWMRPSTADSASYRETARFKIGYAEPPPDRLGYGLTEAFCARVVEWERSLSEAECAGLFEVMAEAPSSSAEPAAAFSRLGINLEWLAVRAGIKPVSRAVVDASEVETLVAAARESGLHAEVQAADDFVAGFCGTDLADGAARQRMTRLLYLARAPAAAAAAAAAERAMIDACQRGEPASAPQVWALGAVLGYPACCIEAFLPLRDQPNAAIRFAALQRTGGAADARLNDMVGGRSLVSHAPCRYDCAESTRYAGAMLAQLAEVDRAAAASLHDSLRGRMVLFRSGGALRLEPRAVPGADALEVAALEVSGAGPELDAWRAVLAEGARMQVSADYVQIWRVGAPVVRLPLRPQSVQIRDFA